MFQRGVLHEGYDDPQFSNFYGQSLPLVKRGVPTRTLHLENVAYPEIWKGAMVLVMSYSNMKPMDSQAHVHIAEWDSKRGKLLYYGTDFDPYQWIQEWWNQNGNNYSALSEHLFGCLGLPCVAPNGEYVCGKGFVRVIREDPKEFVLRAEGDESYVAAVRDLYEKGKTCRRIILQELFCLGAWPL